MTVNFSNVSSCYQALAKKVIKAFLDKYKINPQTQVNITFLSKAKIKVLNYEYRKIDKATDVLSFPIWDSTKIIPKQGKITLGDIFICPDMTEIDANLSFLIEHACKHLIGIHH